MYFEDRISHVASSIKDYANYDVINDEMNKED